MNSELSPVEKRLVWDEAKEAELQKLRHMKAAADACNGISTEALEAGVVEKMRETLESISSAEWVDLALDPEWPQRMASKALALLETKP